MTWSLQLTEDGDLALGSKGLAKATNEKKLVQDLKYELLQKKGNNKFDQNYGSLLEDDVLAETTISSASGGSYTAGYLTDELLLKIESDISEVINRYQGRQLTRAKADKMSRGVATLTPNEVVTDFSVNQIIQNQDNVNIQVDLITAKSNPNAYPVPLTISL